MPTKEILNGLDSISIDISENMISHTRKVYLMFFTNTFADSSQYTWQRQIVIAYLVLTDHQVIFSIIILMVASIKLINVVPVVLTI